MQETKKTGIWIDGSKAIIVNFKESEATVKEIISDLEGVFFRDGQPIKTNFSGGNNDSHEKRLEERKKNMTRKFLKNVCEELQHRDELFILGPGEMRTRLSKFLETEYKTFRDKIKGVERSNIRREQQIIERMKSFFQIVENIEL
jgi:stalled ribosome rescue protein Dom34